MNLRGRLVMMSLSGGLKPSAVAGRPSVTRLTHSSCTGFSTSGRPAPTILSSASVLIEGTDFSAATTEVRQNASKDQCSEN